jgi:hypothetical protein
VERERARRIAEATHNAEAALETAIERLRTTVSDRAADACHFDLTKVLVEVGFFILAPLWDEFPELRPPVADAPGGFDPLGFRIPAAELAPVLEGLAQLRRVMDESMSLFQEGASTPGEERGYLTALASIRDSIEKAHSDLARLRG